MGRLSKLKQCSPANLLSEQKRKLISAVLENGFTNWLMFFATLVALYNDAMLWAPIEYDLLTGILSGVCLVLFFFEMLATLVTKAGYFGRLYFLLDLMACYSLLPDTLLFAFTLQIDTPSTLAVARAGRMARTGMRLGRLGLGRFTKVLSFLSGFAKNTDDSPNDPAFMGRVLMDVTTRKIVAGLLVMLIAIPFAVDAITVVDQSPEYTIDSVDQISNATLAVAMLRGMELDYSNIMYMEYKGDVLTDRDTSHLRFFQIHEFKTASVRVDFDISDEVYDKALKAIIGTTFTVLILLAGTFMLSRDVNKMVIVPIEKLKTTIQKHTLDFDSLEATGGAKTNLIEDALRKVSAIMQVNLNMSNTIESASHGTAAMDEVLRTMEADKGVLLWEDATHSQHHVIAPWEEAAPEDFKIKCSRTAARVPGQRPNDWGLVDEDIPEHISVVCDVVNEMRKPLCVNSRADLKQASQGSSKPFKLSVQGNKELRSRSIVATPVTVKNRFVGIVYLERSKVYRKDMSKFFGEEVSQQKKARRGSMMPGMGRRGSMRRSSVMGSMMPKAKGNYGPKDVQILHAVANQVGIVLQLTRSVADDVGQKWKVTMSEVEAAKKRQQEKEAIAAENVKQAALKAKKLRAANFMALLADVDIPHSPFKTKRRMSFDSPRPRRRPSVSLASSLRAFADGLPGSAPGSRQTSRSSLRRPFSRQGRENVLARSMDHIRGMEKPFPAIAPVRKTGSTSSNLSNISDRLRRASIANLMGSRPRVESSDGAHLSSSQDSLQGRSSSRVLSLSSGRRDSDHSGQGRRDSDQSIKSGERRDSAGSEIRKHFHKRMDGLRPQSIDTLPKGVQTQRRSSIAISSIRFSKHAKSQLANRLGLGKPHRQDVSRSSTHIQGEPQSKTSRDGSGSGSGGSGGSGSGSASGPDISITPPTKAALQGRPSRRAGSGSSGHLLRRASLSHALTSGLPRPRIISSDKSSKSKLSPALPTIEEVDESASVVGPDPRMLISLRNKLEGAGVGSPNPPLHDYQRAARQAMKSSTTSSSGTSPAASKLSPMLPGHAADGGIPNDLHLIPHKVTVTVSHPSTPGDTSVTAAADSEADASHGTVALQVTQLEADTASGSGSNCSSATITSRRTSIDPLAASLKDGGITTDDVTIEVADVVQEKALPSVPKAIHNPQQGSQPILEQSKTTGMKGEEIGGEQREKESAAPAGGAGPTPAPLSPERNDEAVVPSDLAPADQHKSDTYHAVSEARGIASPSHVEEPRADESSDKGPTGTELPSDADFDQVTKSTADTDLPSTSLSTVPVNAAITPQPHVEPQTDQQLVKSRSGSSLASDCDIAAAVKEADAALAGNVSQEPIEAHKEEAGPSSQPRTTAAETSEAGPTLTSTATVGGPTSIAPVHTLPQPHAAAPLASTHEVFGKEMAQPSELRKEGDTATSLSEGQDEDKNHEKLLFSKPLTVLSKEELLEKKRIIKTKVLQFDHEFILKNGTPPTSKDKEPVKHLYEYYRAVKAMLELHASHAPVASSRPKPSPISVPGQSKPMPKISSKLKGKATTADPVSGKNKGKDAAQAPSKTTKPRSKKIPGAPHSQAHSESSDGTHHLHHRLDVLKAEKQALNISLYHFQKEFQREHGRKPTRAEDQHPMRADYIRYKSISNEIEKLQGRINALIGFDVRKMLE